MFASASSASSRTAVSLFLLRDAQAESLTVRGAYLEVFGDLAGSAAVVIAAVIIARTGQTGADAVASVLIALLIIPRTWRLLRDAVDILLEATPKGLDLEAVRAHIREAAGVADVHDLHAWTITSGVNVVSAHVVLRPERGPAGRAGRAVRVPGRRLRHRALDLPAGDRRPAPPRGDGPRLSARDGQRAAARA